MAKETERLPEFDFDAVFDPEDYLYFYESHLTDEQTDKEVEFIVSQLGLSAEMNILDLACGHGRHANRLAGRGFNVTGADRSAGFLEIAKTNAKKKGLNVEYIQQDMRDISFENEFDRVLMLFTSFGYFDDVENRKVLLNIAKALKKDSLCLLDIPNRDYLLKDFRPYGINERGKDLMIDRCEFDSLSGRLINKRIMIRNGKRKDAPIVLRLYNPNETKDLLSSAGFEIVKLFGSFDSAPFTDNSKSMIIIAKKS